MPQKKDASVWTSGLQAGDRVINVNGSDINSSYALTLYSKSSKPYDGKVDEDFVQSNLEKIKKLTLTIK